MIFSFLSLLLFTLIIYVFKKPIRNLFEKKKKRIFPRSTCQRVIPKPLEFSDLFKENKEIRKEIRRREIHAVCLEVRLLAIDEILYFLKFITK